MALYPQPFMCLSVLAASSAFRVPVDIRSTASKAISVMAESKPSGMPDLSGTIQPKPILGTTSAALRTPTPVISKPLTAGAAPAKKSENTRRLKRVQQDDEDQARVSVYAVSEEVDCEALLAGLGAGEVRRPNGAWCDKILEDSIHSHVRGASSGLADGSTKDVFIFSFGCVVLWGFTKRIEREIVAGLLAADYVNGRVLAAERLEAHDTMTFKVDGIFGCKRDVIRLEGDDILEKFSISYALAQSAKLFIWEARVSATIDEIQDIPARLAEAGRTELNEKEISRMIGKVFLERAKVNLASDILDSPDFLWEDDFHEPKYLKVYSWLDVPDRVLLLNQRLDVMKELLEVLNTQLSNKYSSKLELIIIWLIVVEIVVTLATFTLDRILPIPGRVL